MKADRKVRHRNGNRKERQARRLAGNSDTEMETEQTDKQEGWQESQTQKWRQTGKQEGWQEDR
jgi:hypothetical protein